MTSIFVCALALFASVAHAEPAVTQDTANSWIATNSSGQTFFGTWTVDSTATSDSVTGTWTAVNMQGATLAQGKWSAAKSRSGWTGSWMAIADGHGGTYGGTWSSHIEVSRNAPFSELFAAALRAAVGGNWRFGAYSGTWSIRAFGHRT
jgi:hypothetical protein